MTKREFIMEFVLNRAKAGHVTTDAPFWIDQANAAWDRLNEVAPTPKFPPVGLPTSGTPRFDV